MIEAATQEPWSYTDENLAMLIDRLDYWLSSEYTQWTTDPDDPEVKRARAERKKSGEKPPPNPIIIPVAQRPPEQAKAAWEDLVRQREEHEERSKPQVVQPGESKINALDAILG